MRDREARPRRAHEHELTAPGITQVRGVEQASLDHARQPSIGGLARRHARGDGRVVARIEVAGQRGGHADPTTSRHATRDGLVAKRRVGRLEVRDREHTVAQRHEALIREHVVRKATLRATPGGELVERVVRERLRQHLLERSHRIRHAATLELSRDGKRIAQHVGAHRAVVGVVLREPERIEQRRHVGACRIERGVRSERERDHAHALRRRREHCLLERAIEEVRMERDLSVVRREIPGPSRQRTPARRWGTAPAETSNRAVSPTR